MEQNREHYCPTRNSKESLMTENFNSKKQIDLFLTGLHWKPETPSSLHISLSENNPTVSTLINTVAKIIDMQPESIQLIVESKSYRNELTFPLENIPSYNKWYLYTCFR